MPPPRSEFEQVVARALESLPPQVQQRIENVEVMVRLWPTREQLVNNGLRSRFDLFGLYEGVPLTERGSHYGMVLPDRITIFQGPLEHVCASEEELEREIRKTVVHEVAHYFGISDAELEAMGY